tara:strand:+ start:6262 stop:6705 length:444 start_codon:yes stop_codon:yes gene_type:complete
MIDDPFNLNRFVEAQKGEFETALGELKDGRKQSHWIWFVFPQLTKLGRSSTACFFGLRGADEAVAYWNHRVLGRRLRECVEAVLNIENKSAMDILGEVDALKFRSCLTLFHEVAPEDSRLLLALQRFYEGELDPLTVEFLREQPGVA